MRYYKNIFALLIIVLFISCNSTTEPVYNGFMSEYFPTSIGNWWKYENWVLDSNGVRTKLVSVDSIVVEDTLFYEGKNAFKMATYSKREDTTITIISYVALEGSKLLYYLNLKYSDGDSIPWVKSADLAQFNWTIVEKDIKNEYVSTKTEYYEKTSVTKGGIVDYTFRNEVLQAQEFITDYVQRITTITPKDTLKTDMEATNRDLYCKGIGWVYSKYMMLKNVGYDRQGYESILLDYYVK